jgi:hypothetical protein
MSNLGSYLLEVIVTRVCEGQGTEQDRYRVVNYFYDKKGFLLAVSDPNDPSYEKFELGKREADLEFNRR